MAFRAQMLGAEDTGKHGKAHLLSGRALVKVAPTTSPPLPSVPLLSSPLRLRAISHVNVAFPSKLPAHIRTCAR